MGMSGVPSEPSISPHPSISSSPTMHPILPLVVSYTIEPRGGLNSNRRFLSTSGDGLKVDLSESLTSHQKWIFIQVPGLVDTYNIEVEAITIHNNQERRFLSCRGDGFVDLHYRDGVSGRQKWILLPQENGSYLIQVAGGTNAGETYLNCRADGALVDLYHTNDNSGRQEWVLTMYEPTARPSAQPSISP